MFKILDCIVFLIVMSQNRYQNSINYTALKCTSPFTMYCTIVGYGNCCSVIPSCLSWVGQLLIGRVRAEGPAAHGGEWTDGGMVWRRDGEMVSCHLTDPNYKTTLHCAHSWGARPPVTGGKIDDVSVTCRVETHPDISALLSAHVKQGNTGPRNTTLRDTYTHTQRYSNVCVDVRIIDRCMYKTHWKHMQTTSTCRTRTVISTVFSCTLYAA